MFKLLMHQMLLEFRSEWGSIQLKDFGINNNIYLLFISQDCPDLPVDSWYTYNTIVIQWMVRACFASKSLHSLYEVTNNFPAKHNFLTKIVFTILGKEQE